MIATLTLNPSIDVSSSVDRVLPENKLRCEPPKFEPGGGGINVSRAIHKIGGKSHAIYLRGGSSGEELDELLKVEGLQIDPIEVQARTRQNFIVVESSTQRQFRFGMPGESISAGEVKTLLEHVEKLEDLQYLVVSGSIPEGVAPDFYAQIAAITKKKNIKLIVDTSGPYLHAVVDTGAYMVKPNQKELSDLVGRELDHGDELEEAAKEILSKKNIEILMVSLGDKGAMCVSKQGVDYIAPPAIKVRSTVGAGDSLVGGMTWGLSQKMPLHEAARLGVACGSAATMNTGTGLCRPEDVEKIYGWLMGQWRG